MLDKSELEAKETEIYEVMFLIFKVSRFKEEKQFASTIHLNDYNRRKALNMHLRTSLKLKISSLSKPESSQPMSESNAMDDASMQKVKKYTFHFYS